MLLVDGDPSNASVAQHLGFQNISIGFSEVMFNKLDARAAIIAYEAGQIDVLPCNAYSGIYAPTIDQIVHVGKQIGLVDYDFIIVDTPPGFFAPSIAAFYSESLIVSTPDKPSIESSKGLMSLYKETGIKHTFMLNRVGASEYEMKKEDIEKDENAVVSLWLPEDPIISKSIFKQTPAYILDKDSKFSVAMKTVAKTYTSRV